MKYMLYIKSHCEYPDIEDEVEAKSKEEAVKLLIKRNRLEDWANDMVEENVVSEKEVM